MQALIQLLRIAADAMEAQSNLLGAPAADKNQQSPEPTAGVETFQRCTAAYYQLLDKIQFGLRSAVHQLHREHLLLSTGYGGGQLYGAYQLPAQLARAEQRVQLLRNLLRLANSTSTAGNT